MAHDTQSAAAVRSRTGRARRTWRAMLHCLLHPFDGFYECKHRGLKSTGLAVLGIVLYGIMAIVKYQYTGFVVNVQPLHRMNSVTSFISAISVLILFIIANWTITTLFDGKGFVSDILMVVGYSLYPVVAMQLVVVILSNVMTLDEVMLLRALSLLVWAWAAFLVLAGLIVIHEYTLGRTVVTLLATAVSMVIIIFILILYITLMQQLISFVAVVVKEAIRRSL